MATIFQNLLEVQKELKGQLVEEKSLLSLVKDCCIKHDVLSAVEVIDFQDGKLKLAFEFRLAENGNGVEYFWFVKSQHDIYGAYTDFLLLYFNLSITGFKVPDMNGYSITKEEMPGLYNAVNDGQPSPLSDPANFKIEPFDKVAAVKKIKEIRDYLNLKPETCKQICQGKGLAVNSKEDDIKEALELMQAFQDRYEMNALNDNDRMILGIEDIEERGDTQ